MAQEHTRRGIGHDGFDARLGFAPLTVNSAVLAIARMVVGALKGFEKRALNGFAAGRAQALGILGLIEVMGATIDEANSLKGLPIFLRVCHSYAV